MFPSPLDRTPYAFTLDGDDYVMVRGPAWPESGYVRVSERYTLELLESWRHDGEGYLLRRMCMELGLPTREMDGASDATATLAGRVLLHHARDISLFRRVRPALARTATEAVVDLMTLVGSEVPRAEEVDEPDADHWIHITFVDQERNPLVGVDCCVELPDGRIHEGRTDGDGVLWIERIARPGTCLLRGACDEQPRPEPAALVA